jgi:hypothetical protein
MQLTWGVWKCTKILIGSPGKIYGRPRKRLEDNVKMKVTYFTYRKEGRRRFLRNADSVKRSYNGTARDRDIFAL